MSPYPQDEGQKPIHGLVVRARRDFRIYIGPDIILQVGEIQSGYEVKLVIQAPRELEVSWTGSKKRHALQNPSS